MALHTYVQAPFTTGEATLSNSWCLLRGITSKAALTSGQQSELARFEQGSCHPRPIKISTFLQKTLKAFSNVAEAAAGKAERRVCTNMPKIGQQGQLHSFPWHDGRKQKPLPWKRPPKTPAQNIFLPTYMLIPFMPQKSV